MKLKAKKGKEQTNQIGHMPKISPQGLWLLLLFKSKNAEYVDLEGLEGKERTWVEGLLNKILQNIRTEKDLDRLFSLIDEVADGDVFETLERVSMHY